jgi:glutamate racemase
MRCGVFDSGIGGLTVAAELLRAGLFEEIIYYGDTARVPYGNKNESTIIRYGLEGLEFLKNFDIDFMVVGCNSVSAIALPELQKEAPFPVVGVIEAGVEGIKHFSRNSQILLIGTKATIGSGAYQTRLSQLGFEKVVARPTPLFVPLVEEGIWEGRLVEECFNLYFSDLKREEVEVVVLGCTHYPFLIPSLSRYFPNARFIHSGREIVSLLKKRFQLTGGKKSRMEIFASDNVGEVRRIARHWLAHLATLSDGARG